MPAPKPVTFVESTGESNSTLAPAPLEIIGQIPESALPTAVLLTVVLTQEAYDALETPEPGVQYIIIG